MARKVSSARTATPSDGSGAADEPSVTFRMVTLQNALALALPWHRVSTPSSPTSTISVFSINTVTRESMPSPSAMSRRPAPRFAAPPLSPSQLFRFTPVAVIVPRRCRRTSNRTRLISCSTISTSSIRKVLESASETIAMADGPDGLSWKLVRCTVRSVRAVEAPSPSTVTPSPSMLLNSLSSIRSVMSLVPPASMKTPSPSQVIPPHSVAASLSATSTLSTVSVSVPPLFRTTTP